MNTKFLFVFFLSFYIMLQANNKLPMAQSDERAPIDTTFHEVLTKGLNHVYNDRYSEALVIFDSLQQIFPNHPAPNFYIAATYQNWMLSFRFNKFQNDLYENAEIAIDKGNKMLEKNSDPWINFYVGAAYGYKALHRFRQHNWIAAYFAGIKGINNFNKALEKMPNLYDCYYGLGSYYYWRTAKSKFIRTIAFWMKDKRKLGLDQLQFAIAHGRYCPWETIHGLVIAYFDNGDYDRALALNDTAIKLSDPPTLGSLYMRGRLMVHFERWLEVQDIYQKILNRIVAHPYQSVGYQVECKYWIAEALNAQKQLDKAYELTIFALAQSKERNKDNELENAIDNFDDIKKRLEKLHENLRRELAK
ncbi:MAG: hypothetical protein AMJ43_10060 [Coxiella sp. DG_40]|nr:MAG: hypothetical protein AMJ43_10060 [Coxiella sp. DG_40]